MARFTALWNRRVEGPQAVPSAIALSELRRLLGGADRYFHNLDHVRECLQQFDQVASQLDDRDAVELAIWFHDAEFTPGDPSNEWRSARLFLQQTLGADPVLRRRVCGLILATRHLQMARSNDRRFIEDIDLAGFCAPWERFMHHGDLLRQEFAGQPDAQYYAGQVAFLERLRRRPAFYSTERYRRRCERNAQDNLRRVLALRADEGYVPKRP